jgi:hypothetical protein
MTAARFASRVRSPWLTSRLGLALGISFGVCFVTGLLSHTMQHPPGWFGWPARPVALYRVTQGVHVATGIAAIPLLGAKIWSVYPELYSWPPFRSLTHALERLTIAVLSLAALFQLLTGLLNIAHWYDLLPFALLQAHYWTAWVAIGAIILHIGVKLPIIRAGLRHAPPIQSTLEGGLTRRGALLATGLAVAAVTAATVGQTVRPLSRLSVLAPRRPDIGPQGLPVNMSAIGAGVTEAARDPAYRLVLTGPAGVLRLSLDDLAAQPLHTSDLPITCVDGWSAGASWTGVRLAELIALVGGSIDDRVLVESLQTSGSYRSTVVDRSHLADPRTLLALRLRGEPLDIDHGFPCRLIAPNRPGVLQTKWVSAVTVQ